MKKCFYSLMVLGFCLITNVSFAQIPNCAGFDSTLVFLHIGSGNISAYDPALPLSPTNPSPFLTSGLSMGGVAIAYNLNGGVASPTFYTNGGSVYQYWNGAAWVSTGHAVNTVNPGGGVNFIYSKNGGTGQINKYDGTGPALNLVVASANAGPYDLSVDQADNFYHLETYISPGRIIKYNPAGVPIDTFVIVGHPLQTAGGGFAMIGNNVYCIFNSTPSFYSGTIVNDTCFLAAVGNMSASDVATCPSKPATNVPPVPPVAGFSISSYTICAGTCVTFTDTSQNGPINWTWTFPSGSPSGSILQNPGLVCFNTPGVYDVELIVSNFGGADTTIRTITVLPVPIASIAGDNEICEGEFTTLTASPAGINYAWDNAATTQAITVSPAVSTTYTVIVSQNICADTATFFVQVWPFVSGAISNDTLVCNGTPVQLWVTGGTGQYQWYPAQTLSCEFCPNPVASALGSITYNAILLDPHGCQDTLSVRVENHPPFNLILHNGSDTTIYLGDNVQLRASGAPFYYWTPSTYLTYSQSNSPLATPLEDITYTVTGVSLLQGCPQTDSIRIHVIQQDVVLPNAFSPNGDGLNDIFRVTARKFITVQEFKIFNRWGTEVFSTQDIRKGWDGNYKGVAQDPNVYYYLVRVSYPNGKTQFLRGDLTLIR